MAITKRSALTGQAENKNAGAAAKPAQKAPEVQEKKGLWDTLSRHVMTGISNMIPFLIMGGLILAFSQLIPYVILGVDPSMGIVDAMNSGAYEGFNLSLLKFANLCADFGGTLFGFAIPMFAAFMANSIGGKLAFPAGFIGGLMATKPTAVLSLADGTWTTTAPVASTFLGALIIAIAAGYFVKYLNQKIKYTSRKTTREKLMAYLTDQAKMKGSNDFTISFNRQELADYLGVERSAMSTELGKLTKLGILQTQRSHFTLLKPLD